jgi:serine/threonine-protein kinase
VRCSGGAPGDDGADVALAAHNGESHPMSSTLPRQVDHYRLEEKLGAGGMGVVYRATDTLLDRPVAIKMMHTADVLGVGADVAEVQGRFLREAKAAARIKSRYVAGVLQLGTTPQGEAYIVMEFLQGEPLNRVLARVGRLPAARAVAIARQIGRGMQAAHDLGIVHRDLKPANVMLVRDEGEEVAKVLDFGVAKITNEQHTAGLTQAGALLGTLPFMAPEQLTSSPVDARTDVYALGIMLYRMLTGVAVWEVESLSDIVRHQLSSPPPSMLTRVTNPGFSVELDQVVLRCLEKDPARRWPSMRELGDALDEALRAPAVAAPSTSLTLDAALEAASSSVGAAIDDLAEQTAATAGGFAWRAPASAGFVDPASTVADDGTPSLVAAVTVRRTGGLVPRPVVAPIDDAVGGGARVADDLQHDHPTESAPRRERAITQPRAVVAAVAPALPAEAAAPRPRSLERPSVAVPARRARLVGVAAAALIVVAAAVGLLVARAPSSDGDAPARDVAALPSPPSTPATPTSATPTSATPTSATTTPATTTPATTTPATTTPSTTTPATPTPATTTPATTTPATTTPATTTPATTPTPPTTRPPERAAPVKGTTRPVAPPPVGKPVDKKDAFKRVLTR